MIKMNNDQVSELKIRFQEVIDLIGQKNSLLAEEKLNEAIIFVNDLIDTSTTDEELQSYSQFQILSNHLQLKIDVLKTNLN